MNKSAKNEIVDLNKHLSDLRLSYIKANPWQRMLVAMDRIFNPECGPNKLIVLVSAVEGFSRSLLLYALSDKGHDIESIYDKKDMEGHSIKNNTAEWLIMGYLKEKYTDKSPNDIFGIDTWRDFCTAIKYRDLLLHECTYLQQGISNRLITATNSVFDKLKDISGTSEIFHINNDVS